MNPPDPWTSIIDGALWESTKPGPGGFPLRSVALELAGGGVAVYSPTRGLDVEALERHAGPVRALLAPNHYHHLGIKPWAESCPRAAAVCSEVARPRLTRQVDVPWEDLEGLTAALPDGAELLVPEGTRTGEVWLLLERGDARALVVCDAFFNLKQVSRGLVGLLLRASSTGPGLRLGSTFKLLALKDRAAYKQWTLDLLERTRPNVLVPCHGEVLRGADLGARLLELTRARL